MINDFQAITLQTQLKNFIEVGKSLRKKLGDNRAQNLLSNSVYLISTGGNDYISLFEGDSTAFQIYTQTQYVNMVIGNLTAVIQVNLESISILVVRIMAKLNTVSHPLFVDVTNTWLINHENLCVDSILITFS